MSLHNATGSGPKGPSSDSPDWRPRRKNNGCTKGPSIRDGSGAASFQTPLPLSTSYDLTTPEFAVASPSGLNFETSIRFFLRMALNADQGPNGQATSDVRLREPAMHGQETHPNPFYKLFERFVGTFAATRTRLRQFLDLGLSLCNQLDK